MRSVGWRHCYTSLPALISSIAHLVLCLLILEREGDSGISRAKMLESTTCYAYSHILDLTSIFLIFALGGSDRRRLERGRRNKGEERHETVFSEIWKWQNNVGVQMYPCYQEQMVTWFIWPFLKVSGRGFIKGASWKKVLSTSKKLSTCPATEYSSSQRLFVHFLRPADLNIATELPPSQTEIKISLG